MRRTRIALAALAVVLGVTAAADLSGPGVASPAPEAGVAGKIEADLAAAMAAARPDDFVAAVVVVRGQADLTALDTSRRRQRPAAAKRLLRAAAEGHQRSLLGWLAAARSAGSVASVTPLWIEDAVSVRATPAALRQIAARADVVRVDPERTFLAPAALPAVPVESNITQVGAPTLWDLGFTGQGSSWRTWTPAWTPRIPTSPIRSP